jgi:hypothetical protein
VVFLAISVAPFIGHRFTLLDLSRVPVAGKGACSVLVERINRIEYVIDSGNLIGLAIQRL